MPTSQEMPGDFALADSSELQQQAKERERKIQGLRAVLANLERMQAADPEPPLELIRRKDHDERLNMAQDNFLVGLEIELLALAKSRLLDSAEDQRRVLFYRKLIKKMFQEKERIVESGHKQELSEEAIFNAKREQRIRDIKILREIMDILDVILKDAAMRHGVSLEGTEIQFYDKL